MNLLEKIRNIGIVPVIKIDNLEDAYPLAKALMDGGIPIAEVTFRTAIAKDAMAIITKELPEMIVGAGTVLTTSQVDDAIDAGATFIVSPGLNPKIVEYCKSKNIPILPGCSNASDIEMALELGLETVKFFPAEQAGGIKMIKALAAPYTKLEFMPTGGVNAANVNDYLSFDKIVACGGTWMIDAAALKSKNYEKITELSITAIQSMLGLRLEHLGVNAKNEDVSKIAKKFSVLFGGLTREVTKGQFGSDFVEVVNEDYHTGSVGHLAIGTYHVARARRYFESIGFEFDESTALYDDNGRLKFIYLTDEVAGFKVHLMKRGN